MHTVRFSKCGTVSVTVVMFFPRFSLFIKVLLLITIATFILFLFHTYNTFLQTILILTCFLLYFLYCFCKKIQDEEIENNVPNTFDENNNNNLEQIEIIQINNLRDLNNNYNSQCCICLDEVDPIIAFRLSSCNYHIFHDIVCQ